MAKKIPTPPKSRFSNPVRTRSRSTSRGTGRFLKSGRIPPKAMLQAALWVVGILLFVISGWLWYAQVYNDPERVFWDLVDNNLSTPSVTRTVNQSDGANRSTEVSQLIFGPTQGVAVHKDIVQTGDEGSSHIVVEGLASPTDDYQRYISVDRTMADGKKMDYSSVENQWVHTGNSGEASTQPPQLHSQTLLSSLVFGNLTPAQRHAVIAELRSKNAYQVNYKTVLTKEQSGRKQYVYTVKVNLQGLAAGLQKYGKATGLASVSGIDPQNYNKNDSLDVELTVDVSSRQLRSANYKSAGVTERYSSYGVTKEARPPATSINLQKFNELLSAIEK